MGMAWEWTQGHRLNYLRVLPNQESMEFRNEGRFPDKLLTEWNTPGQVPWIPKGGGGERICHNPYPPPPPPPDDYYHGNGLGGGIFSPSTSSPARSPKNFFWRQERTCTARLRVPVIRKVAGRSSFNVAIKVSHSSERMNPRP